MIKALIVDDEPLARKGIRRLLASEDVQVVGECADGIEAVNAIQAKRPELVFLDIQMPGLDGFGVISAIGPAAMPVVIFVTAYDLHAMRAFDVHAVDYLLKPVTAARLAIALERARAFVGVPRPSELSRKLDALVRTLTPPQRALERIVIKSIGRVTVVPVEEIDWIEAEGDYVKLHSAQRSYLLREKISTLEEQLDKNSFMRIHRSTIVRVGHVRELRPLVNGDHVVILQGGRQLSLSRTFREQVFARLQFSR
jgi:two-component system LytT family response regulator